MTTPNSRDRIEANKIDEAAWRLTPNEKRPTAVIEDPLLRRHAYRVDHVGLNAFLVALAAWQRGLKVTFHYEVATKCERFADAAVQGYRGELFSISDCNETHVFRRTLGDLTSRAVSQRCENKQATKQRLAEHAIAVPAGVVVTREDSAGAQAFMAQYPDRQFVVKPLDGTLGEGVHRRLSAAEVITCLEEHANTPHLLEEFIDGSLFRVNVVGNRYVGAYELRVANVDGDGQSTVAQLVEQKNAACRHRPLHTTQRLALREREQAFIRARGLSPATVLPAGQRLYLNDIPLGSEGADLRDATHEVPKLVRTMAIKACQALEIEVAGLDVIIGADGRGVILEANQNPLIYGNVFPRQTPSPGNRVAEAIIDHYFPESIHTPRHIRASFDFVKVCETLQSGMIGEVTLPMLGRDWVHRRFQVAAASQDDKTLPSIRQAMFVYGIHAQLFNNDKGDLIVDVMAPEALYASFVTALKREHK